MFSLGKRVFREDVTWTAGEDRAIHRGKETRMRAAHFQGAGRVRREIQKGSFPMKPFFQEVWRGLTWTLIAGLILLAAALVGRIVGLWLAGSPPPLEAKCLDSMAVCRRAI
jgi:hypothetical protein